MRKDRISCEELLERLFVYLDRELDNQARSEIDHHLEQCRDCFSRVEFEKRLRHRVSGAGIQKAPERLHIRVRKILDRF